MVGCWGLGGVAIIMADRGVVGDGVGESERGFKKETICISISV